MGTISVSAMTRDQLLQMQASGRVYQERADNALAPWDIRAPAPVLGEDIGKYRRDLAVKLKRQLPENHKLRKIQYRRLDDAILTAFEPQLYQAVQAEAHNPSSVPPGEFRRVVKVDGNGSRMVEWIGQESFVKEFTRPGRRVTSFHTDQGFIDASGRPLR
jgi:hypothetical protein